MVSWSAILKALIFLAYRFVCAYIRTLVMILLGILLLFKYNRTFRRTVWFFYQQIAALGIGLVWCTLICPVLFLRQRQFKNVLTFSLFAKPLMRLLGIHCEIRNKENMVKENECAIIVSNHPSKLDFLSMLYMIDNMEMVTVGTVASNVLWLGPLSWALQQCRFGFIKRTSGLQSTYEEINKLADAAYKEKIKIWFFPEGCTSEKLLPFKKGAFRVAIDKKIPIVPVVFSPHNFVDWDNLQAREGKIIMNILPPISTTDYTHENMNSLIEKTHTIISRKYEELTEEVENERQEHTE